MHTAYLGLGTNLGDKTQSLRDAVKQIEKQIGHVSALSAFYITEPWGFSSEHTFLNAALAVQTTLEPLDLLTETQQIERMLGRTSKSLEGNYADRLIDIDLLLIDDLVFRSSQLTLPHPLLQERDFVLRPLAEIAPQLLHPLLKKTIGELLESTGLQ